MAVRKKKKKEEKNEIHTYKKSTESITMWTPK